jgi:ADP-ribose pyrophosphatase YjhB (NUDIX family)
MSDVVACAGAVVFDADGRLLLVRRRNPPSAGLWCEPSGRCEPGESPAQACMRETREETGLEVQVERPVGSVVVPGPDGRSYDIADFECTVLGGTLRAADDADDVRWVDLAEFDRLPLVPLLRETLQEWGCLPRC